IGRLGEMLFVDRADREDIEAGIRKEMTGALQRFLKGYLHAHAVVTDTLVIRGVLDHRMSGPSREKPLVIPAETARRLAPGSLGNNPADLFAYLNSGAPIDFEGGLSGKNYSNATLHLASQADPQAVADTLRAMGYRVFSYAEEFREMRKFFLFFDVALGVVGFIALVVASLGIVNTLVTSIVERRKEIGILKSLGADEGRIRLLFLVESGMIGALGSSVGIVFGWVITRVASAIARAYLERQGAPDMDLFALPPWLILVGFFFGLGVSVAAGLYPAARAAAVDPVEALRND
ncbi:MAG: FtsX-like permease family protein, partial [Acidobacteriota bacterium]